MFASFNQTYKINPEVFDAWMAILRAVPGSRAVAPAQDATTIRRWRTCGAKRKRAASILRASCSRGIVPIADYLALYRHADLFLDTWPYNAHTTASDALWAGCPVLTILGTTFAGRVAASLLHAVGLPELVTPSIEDYVARAIALAGDDAERARLRAHLAGPGRASALFDTARTTRALEAAYLTMAAQHRAACAKPSQSLPRSRRRRSVYARRSPADDGTPSRPRVPAIDTGTRGEQAIRLARDVEHRARRGDRERQPQQRPTARRPPACATSASAAGAGSADITRAVKPSSRDVVVARCARVVGQQVVEPVVGHRSRVMRPYAASAALSFCLPRSTWVLTVPTGQPST